MQQQRQSAGVTGAYVIVTCLFFAWGFITSLNDPVVTAVKGIFCLTDVRAQLSAAGLPQLSVQLQDPFHLTVHGTL